MLFHERFPRSTGLYLESSLCLLFDWILSSRVGLTSKQAVLGLLGNSVERSIYKSALIKCAVQFPRSDALFRPWAAHLQLTGFKCTVIKERLRCFVQIVQEAASFLNSCSGLGLIHRYKVPPGDTKMTLETESNHNQIICRRLHVNENDVLGNISYEVQVRSECPTSCSNSLSNWRLSPFLPLKADAILARKEFNTMYVSV